MEEKIEKMVRNDHESEKEKIESIKRKFEELGTEKNGFLGYIQIKMDMSNAAFTNKTKGVTRFSPLEIEYILKVMEGRPWRQVV